MNKPAVAVAVFIFSYITVVYTPIYTDGAWILDHKIYGFPLPYIYNNVVSSMEYDIIVLFMVIDFVMYCVLTALLFYVMKKCTMPILLKIKPVTYKKLLFALYAAAVLVILFHACAAFILNYSIIWKPDYHGSKLIYEAIQFGFYWF
jgi:hypothetical protein